LRLIPRKSLSRLYTTKIVEKRLKKRKRKTCFLSFAHPLPYNFPFPVSALKKKNGKGM